MQFKCSMFKKIIHLIISGFLLAAITGITVNMHYCGDKLYSSKVNSKADKCCDNNQCGHCKDKSVQIKTHDDFLPVINDDLLTEILPVHLFVSPDNFTSSEPVLEKATQNIYSSDISPPGAMQILSLLQTYLL
jgi:hypothetical protein